MKKYIIIGTLSTIFSMMVFKIILDINLSILFTLILHYLIVSTIKFVLQIKYVFKKDKFNNSFKKILLNFFIINLVIIAFNYLYLFILNSYLNEILYLQYSFIFLMIPVYYYLSKNVIYK